MRNLGEKKFLPVLSVLFLAAVFVFSGALSAKSQTATGSILVESNVATTSGAGWNISGPSGNLRPSFSSYASMAMGDYTLTAIVPSGYKLTAIKDANGRSLTLSGNSATQTLCSLSPSACYGGGGNEPNEPDRGPRLFFWKVPKAFAQTGLYIKFSLVYDLIAPIQPPPAAGTVGTLNFSPGTVSPSVNNGAYTISVGCAGNNCAPADSGTRLYVDNWLDTNADGTAGTDPGTFTDFGVWINTAANGVINQARNLTAATCKSYNTYELGKNADITGKKLHQRIYIVYAKGGRSPEATQIKDCTAGGTPPPQNPPPTGGTVGTAGPRCYFSNPPQNTYGLTQNASYNSTINPGVCAAGMTNCDLAWKAVMGTATPPNYASGDLAASDGYSATLSGGGFANQPVALSGTQKLSSYSFAAPTTYTLKVSKNGASVASCNIILNNEPAPPPAPPAYNPSANFFPGGSYSLNIKGATSTANYNYAPTLPNITVSEYATLPIPYSVYLNYGLRLYAGQFFKNIYFGIASYAVPYGDGRWDISDPMNPKGPDFIPVGQAQGKGQGPLFDGAWGHEMFTNDNSSAAEGPDGSARMHMVFGSVQVGNRTQSPLVALGWDSQDSKGYFGQEIDSKYVLADPGQILRNGSGDYFDGRASAIMDYSSSGNFFLYYVAKTNIPILDVTSLSGSTDQPFLTQSASVGWSGVMELQIIRDPATDKHYLIGRTGEPTKPTIKIGELNPDSGRVTRTKNQSIVFGNSFLNGRTCPAGCSTSFSPGSNIKSFNVGSKTYVLMPDDFKYKPGTFGASGQGDFIFGLYRFNPSDITLSKISAITLKNFTLGAIYNYEVAADINGGAYPVMAMIQVDNSIPQSPQSQVSFYSLKPAFSNSAVTFSDPDFAVPNTPAPKPVKPGDLVLNLYPFQTFLRNESGSVKMYFYRPAYKHVGERTFFDNPFEVTPGGCGQILLGGGVNYYGCRGDASLRVDQFDLTSIASGAPSATPPAGGTPPTGDGNPPPGGPPVYVPPPVTDNQCIQKYGIYCDQITQLLKQICALVPTDSVCQNGY